MPSDLSFIPHLVVLESSGEEEQAVVFLRGDQSVWLPSDPSDRMLRFPRSRVMVIPGPGEIGDVNEDGYLNDGAYWLATIEDIRGKGPEVIVSAKFFALSHSSKFWVLVRWFYTAAHARQAITQKDQRL